MAAKKPLNPFYPLLVIAGTAFCITACAYGVLAMRALRPDRPNRSAASEPVVAESGANGAVASGATTNGAGRPHPLMEYLERDGEKLLLSELGLLALFSFAAMGTDGYWTRRAQAAADRTKATSSEKQT